MQFPVKVSKMLVSLEFQSPYKYKEHSIIIYSYFITVVLMLLIYFKNILTQVISCLVKKADCVYLKHQKKFTCF